MKTQKNEKMIEGFEELEKIEKEFIVEDDLEYEKIKQLASRILNFCKIDKNGYVIIFRKNLKTVDKILLIFCARCLGNKLQQKLGREITIREEVSNREIANILKEKENVVSARINELRKDKKIICVKRGIHKVAPHIIEEFLTKLEKVGENE